jgi:hypothetical protein
MVPQGASGRNEADGRIVRAWASAVALPNKDQRALDKEPLREWIVERGFGGDREAPVMTDEVRIATATRYIILAEELTQRSFEASELTAASPVANVLRE